MIENVIYISLIVAPIIITAYVGYREFAYGTRRINKCDEKVTNDIDGFMKIYVALTTEKEKEPTQGDNYED